MQKFLVSLCLLTLSFSANALSADAQQLKDKLAVFEQINATFTQKVSSAEGKLLNKSTGEMTISRPGKFHWQVITPEEDLIVSDGKTIWYYSPFIEQVTLINFADAITGTPFALLAGATKAQWADYVVTKKGNIFSVTNPKQVQATRFIFEFDNNNNINKFVVIEEQGQRSEFLLTHKKVLTPIDDAMFKFNIPAGVEVDDQR
ncbi:outer membrane lipoprotein chaperone LolA [Psychromonas sp. Urea-02u-13]|uniref:outer membrane lipoprotein chaperone LolA n=1 Tax=Psychromonas sp. Urea-02u-13 TaxID=2058326 RepID=UPI000C338A5C|nr:outer membrane lipoprotein chaperone LolA [Psychromonas sp. Urea-02u-13]PKG39023.1 outer membrane lipoprotein carrier protein LolA [Psychromonas sp. Urea-02u-13]